MGDAFIVPFILSFFGSTCSKGEKAITVYSVRLKRYMTLPLDSSIGFPHTYPVHSDLFGGLMHHLAFKKTGAGPESAGKIA